MVTIYLCPVCGYGMEDPPSDFNICSCCGTEFGYHDANSSTATLRATWLRGGAKWWSPTDPIPDGWDPYAQVSDLLSQASVWQALLIPTGNLAGSLAKLTSEGISNAGILGQGQVPSRLVLR